MEKIVESQARPAEKIGIIDLGSNSARLVIVRLFGENHFMVEDELKESVRLGQDMERDGFLKPQRVAETIRTLKMFKRLCDANGVERIIAVATAAVRRAKNQRSFLDEIQATCGIRVDVNVWYPSVRAPPPALRPWLSTRLARKPSAPSPTTRPPRLPPATPPRLQSILS